MLRAPRRRGSIVKLAARASARSSSRSELSGSSRNGLLPARISDVHVWRNRQLYNPVKDNLKLTLADHGSPKRDSTSTVRRTLVCSPRLSVNTTLTEYCPLGRL